MQFVQNKGFANSNAIQIDDLGFFLIKFHYFISNFKQGIPLVKIV